jgi:hypothetical protein
MKRATFSVLTLIVMAGLVGCATHRHLPASCVGGDCTVAPSSDGCAAGACDPSQASCGGSAQPSCGDPGEDCGDPAKKHRCLLAGLCRQKCRAPCEQPAVDSGPPAGAITYPYYTVRGPRDFLAKSPTPIGP